MLEPVHTEEKQGIFQPQSRHGLIGNRNGFNTRPNAGAFNRRSFEIRTEFPVQFDFRAVVADKNIVNSTLRVSSGL